MKTAAKLPEVKYCTKPMLDADGVQATSGILENGKEETDPTPIAPPVGYNAPPDLMTMIRTMIQSEALRAELSKHELETFEEADDFEIEDDPIDALTEYERVFEPPPNPLPAAPAGPASTAAAAATPVPEVLDTSGLGDTSPEPNKEPTAPKK